ncbi:MAG: hypothetical protein GY927_17400, partial [bacterium]|nr:hypothetical protein [bacterium]
MNSAEKKAPEPSMDDIISSIRNIISDDAQETVPAHEAPAVEAPAPAIVQLTENQIAEPAIEQVSGVSATPDAMVPNPLPEPVAVQSTPDLEIANEIDAVPGLMTALETSISAEAPAPVAPKLTVSEPLPPATQVEAAPINDGMAPTAPTIMPATSEAIATPAPQAAITPELAASELNAQVPAASLSLDEPATIIEDDIVFVSPEVSQNSLTDTSLAPDALSTTPTNDPVEEMMQSVNADQAESDLVSN